MRTGYVILLRVIALLAVSVAASAVIEVSFEGATI